MFFFTSFSYPQIYIYMYTYIHILCHPKATPMVLIQNYEDLHWSFLHQISKNRVKEDELENPVKEDLHKWDYSIPVSENRVEEDREEDHYELDNPIPVGFQFLPTNEELVTEYLINKIFHNPLPFWDFSEVEEAALYSTHPKSLVDFANGEKKWYFYIHKDKNFSNNTIRKVEDNLGSWSLKWYEEIQDTKGSKIAFNNHFVFFSKRRKKTHWKMDELQLRPEWYKDFNLEEEWALGILKRGTEYH
ncbi:hypothetical protein V6Z11_D09G273200 [Gossypium hirsutum]|uniref:Protein CUP-SHAPED COTYLEDON 3 isoform X1 n=1 Tax=Gossypium hirsutum TaxID=3635 RepID=A0ABM3ARB8_GOSHI|nr:protein CUP-SHAPED COTYLEDON 3-like isoform X1 [Gossypium hirsutum]